MDFMHLVAVVVLFSASNQMFIAANVNLPTPDDGCGYSKAENHRIVGGSTAKRGAWPWLARIGANNETGDVFYHCGGSLITSRHVLTAAHCFTGPYENRHGSKFTVRLGEYDTNTLKDGPNLDIEVASIEKHSSYGNPALTNDIAILTLERDVEFTKRIRPVCLPLNEPLKSERFVGDNPFVAGWGNRDPFGNPATVLQQLQIPILEDSKCTDFYERFLNCSKKQFSEAVICAGILEGGRSDCQGDSGGPLMLPKFEKGGKFAYFQIGIVSAGIGCALKNTPSIETRVTHFADWIKKTINKVNSDEDDDFDDSDDDEDDEDDDGNGENDDDNDNDNEDSDDNDNDDAEKDHDDEDDNDNDDEDEDSDESDSSYYYATYNGAYDNYHSSSNVAYSDNYD